MDSYKIDFNEEDISFLSSLPCPPVVVTKVFTSVMVAFKQKETAWKDIKAFIKKKKFSQSLLDYDINQLSFPMLKKIYNHVKDLNEEGVKDVTEIILSIYLWIKKIVNIRIVKALENSEPVPVLKKKKK
uniref:Uncharacterized protein n=1 Tax=Euplotes crassus TaxID=5936 RepID=A0A7S3NWN5_EUPCR|mmetsp:Transcript_27906/g.27767  ORF Transcript_27906/g.27767 Transcript_27906/m.27767 type:complete len:129 (+) Transcript_27906:765-1151(+)